jgi:hypothetical protein
MKHAMVLLALAGCVEHKAGVTVTQSIDVELVGIAASGSGAATTDPGDLQHRLPVDQRVITINLTALDARGVVDASFDRKVAVYAQFLGTLTPPLNTVPTPNPVTLATFQMSAGKAMAQTVTLPPVFGPTTLWVDDGIDADATYATGASPTLWYRDPFIADIQTPPDEKALNALSDSPLENKQVAVSTSRYGDAGRLVVTSVFAQGYTVADVKCSDAGGAPPCTAAAYDAVEVFSFSAPTDQSGKLLQQGQLIDGFTGGISEFNGLTEIGFPGTRASSAAVTPDRQPAPVKLDPASWFDTQASPPGIINFERNEAAPIEVDMATVCALDSDYDRFKQWKIDASGGGCAGTPKIINVVTAGVINDLDPATLVGKKLPRVVGVLRPVFNIWIIFPRSAADLTLQ